MYYPFCAYHYTVKACTECGDKALCILNPCVMTRVPSSVLALTESAQVIKLYLFLFFGPSIPYSLTTLLFTYTVINLNAVLATLNSEMENLTTVLLI